MYLVGMTPLPPVSRATDIICYLQGEVLDPWTNILLLVSPTTSFVSGPLYTLQTSQTTAIPGMVGSRPLWTLTIQELQPGLYHWGQGATYPAGTL